MLVTALEAMGTAAGSRVQVYRSKGDMISQVQARLSKGNLAA